MTEYAHVIQGIALSMGVAWASGINLYAAMMMLGLLSATGHVDLPPGLSLLGDPLVIAASTFMYFVEFFADKIPGVDSSWDALHTFIRIPAGALLAVAALGHVDPAAQLAAAVVGGGIASATHFTKAGTRLLINTSPEPFSNWAASLSADAMVFLGLWQALFHPGVFLVLLLVFVLLVAWLLPKLLRLVAKVFRAIGRALGIGKPPGPGIGQTTS